MNVERFRIHGLTRRRYLAYLFVVSLLGGTVVGYLLGDEHTLPALAAGGLVAVALAAPTLLARRPLFDERDRRIDDRAARYVMGLVTASSIVFLAGPIVLEQLGVVPLQGWMLFVGLVLIAQVYVYVGISLLLRYHS
jgi:uncharacterized membrane protein